MAASGSSFPPAASDSAIARDGIGADVSRNPGRSSLGPDTIKRRDPAYRSTFDDSLARHASTVRNSSDIPRWRADPTRIWSAPSSHSDSRQGSRQGSSRIQKSPSPPDVYRHNSSHTFQRYAASSGQGSQSFGSDHMRAAPAPSLSTFAASPPPSHSAYPTQGARTAHAHGGDELAYWSGFEDGVQYERQREAFAQRSGEP